MSDFDLMTFKWIKELDPGYGFPIRDYLNRAGAPRNLLSLDRYGTVLDVYPEYRKVLYRTPNRLLRDLPKALDYNPLAIGCRPYSQIDRANVGLLEASFSGLTSIVCPGDVDINTLWPREEEAEKVSFSLDGPHVLFRGQGARTGIPLSPMCRALTSEQPSIRLRLLGWDSTLIRDFPALSCFTQNISLNMRLGLSSMYPCEYSDEGEAIVLPTPFHLALARGPVDFNRAVDAARRDALCLMDETLPLLKEAGACALLSHLTDHDFPVPVCVTTLVLDLIPNPFVSATKSLRVALSFASGSEIPFCPVEGPDNEWISGLRRKLRTNQGTIYVIRVDRPVLPISELAAAATLGAVEGEYGIPGAIMPSEIIAAIPVAALVEGLEDKRLRNLLIERPGARSDLGAIPQGLLDVYKTVWI